MKQEQIKAPVCFLMTYHCLQVVPHHQSLSASHSAQKSLFYLKKQQQKKTHN